MLAKKTDFVEVFVFITKSFPHNSTLDLMATLELEKKLKSVDYINKFKVQCIVFYKNDQHRMSAENAGIILVFRFYSIDHNLCQIHAK